MPTVKESNKFEISEKLEKIPSTFSKIEYLERVLKEKTDIAIKKFCDSRLASLYMERKMYQNAAKHLEAVARNSLTHEEKVKNYMEVVKVFLDAGDYESAEKMFEVAISFENKLKKPELKREFMILIKQSALKHENDLKHAKALEGYEKIYEIGDDIDKREVKERLLHYYNKLGKIREYTKLKQGKEI